MKRLKEAGDPGIFNLEKMHVIKLIDSFEHCNHLCIVMEALEENLREVLKHYGNNIGLSLDGVRLYAKQILIALYYLRKNHIIHADCNFYLVKPDNIMVGKDKKHIKLCDFGSAILVEESTITEYMVSRFYRAPELMLGCPFDSQIDIWSAGVTLFELYTGRVLFSGHTNNEMLHCIMKVKGKISTKMISRGAFSSKHFTDKFEFILHSKNEKSSKIVEISNESEQNLGTLLINNIEEDKDSLKDFRELLEKLLVIDSHRRILPAEALVNKFISDLCKK